MTKQKTVLLMHPRPIYPPMAALYLAGALERAGVRCEILPSNCSKDELANVVESIKPDVVAMSVITSQDIPFFVGHAKFVKNSYSSIPVVWGGIHPSLNAEQCASEDFIDYVITGHGEAALPEFMQNLGALRCSGKIIRGSSVKDMDGYSPMWEKIDISKFVFPEEYSVHSPDKIAYDANGHKKKNNIFYYLITSRGCVYNCTFCSEPLGVINRTSDGRRNWSAHSFEWVKREVTYIKNELGKKNIKLDGIGIWDDMFWVDMERSYRILDLLKSENLGYFIEARADQLLRDDAALLRKLGDTGCIQVFVGAESADQTTLNYLRKGTKFTDYVKLIELGEKCHVAVRLSLIIGFPGETDDSVNKTLDFSDWVSAKKGYASISGPKIFTPYPGTVEFDRAVARGLVIPKDTVGWGEIHRKSERYIALYPWLTQNLLPDTIKRLEKLLARCGDSVKTNEPVFK
ncbi:MAG: B12-binding domain-containing radical SAM protein [Candidatus Omnitrophica bacterium]|nr:B12-binding domain-containing radical SAM protein [Candidatus Omnitrophota bacterium]